MRKIFISSVFILCAFCKNGFCEIKALPKEIEEIAINKDVQLKDNGWVKIIDKEGFVDIETEKDRYEFLKRIDGANTERTPPEHPNNITIIRYLPKIQFLKPCTASYNEEDAKKLNRSFESILGPTALGYDFKSIQFLCDYRYKVFITFFASDGKEIETIGEYIRARAQFDGGNLKTEMLPGESIFTLFTVPKGAVYYYTWVPK